MDSADARDRLAIAFLTTSFAVLFSAVSLHLASRYRPTKVSPREANAAAKRAIDLLQPAFA